MKQDSYGNYIDSAGTVFQTPDRQPPSDLTPVKIIPSGGGSQLGTFSNGNANPTTKSN
jgi:hypothetical protein